jgi:hypothetical protein
MVYSTTVTVEDGKTYNIDLKGWGQIRRPQPLAHRQAPPLGQRWALFLWFVAVTIDA